MKQRIPSLLILLLLVGLALGALFLTGRSAGEAQLQEATAVIDPAVLDALQTEDEVEVIIGLKQPEVPLAEATLAELQQNAAERQARVLAVLTPSDFTLIRQYEAAAALFGRVTLTGVQKLANHPDVVGVGINGQIDITGWPVPSRLSASLASWLGG